MTSSFLAHRAVSTPDAPPATEIDTVSPVLVPGPVTDDGRVSRHARYLFNEAFGYGPLAGAYYVSQRLTELFPDRALAEIRGFEFSAVDFAAKGNCSWSVRAAPYPHWIERWCKKPGRDGHLHHELWQAWIEVEWEGERLEVITLHWEGAGRGNIRHSFVLAEERDTVCRFIRAVCDWRTATRDELLVFHGSSWEKDEDLFRAIKDARLEDLVLPPGQLEALLADVEGFFAAREVYARYRIPWKRGLLLAGPPGNGKTHAIKALVNRLPYPCLYVKSLVGHGSYEESVNDVFEKARQVAPCVLVFEDLDSLVTKHNRSYFLNEMDGFAGNDGILALATSNHPEKLDPALVRRPSRFDRTYRFDLPATVERETYLRYWNAGLETELAASPEAIASVAAETEGFSYAYLKELCLSAVLGWVREQIPGSMDRVLTEQAELLRAQMTAQRSAK